MRTILLICSLFLVTQFHLFADDPWTVKGVEATIQRDVVYGHKDGLAMTLDVFKPVKDPNGSAIIQIISGGWFSSWDSSYAYDRNIVTYVEAGYTVFAVRHGSSPRYSLQEIIEDIKRSVRFVRLNSKRFSIDPDKIAMTGGSAGGHLALMIGTTGDDGDPEAEIEIERVSSRVGAVAALVPPTDLRVAVWSAPETKPSYRSFPALDMSVAEAESFSPVTLVTRDDAPAIFYMAEKDEIFPPIHGQWMSDAMEKQAVPFRYHVFPNAGHWPGQENVQIFQRDAIEWFNKHLNAEDQPLK